MFLLLSELSIKSGLLLFVGIGRLCLKTLGLLRSLASLLRGLGFLSGLLLSDEPLLLGSLGRLSLSLLGSSRELLLRSRRLALQVW